jgi:hypothetical protein
LNHTNDHLRTILPNQKIETADGYVRLAFNRYGSNVYQLIFRFNNESGVSYIGTMPEVFDLVNSIQEFVSSTIIGEK